MIQDIAPHTFDNQYRQTEPQNDAYILNYNNRSVLADEKLQLPKRNLYPKDAEFIYLFTLAENAYFLYKGEFIPDGFQYASIPKMRAEAPKLECFAVSTGLHLANWYKDNRFCGRCGKELVKNPKLRMLSCECGNCVFPKIAPAVIVGVIDTKKERILMTRYAGREYKKYALIAGFTEIGETAEQTVAREVMEEAGVRVKNITYYKSQPWGFDSNLLLGFFAELDGDDTITLDEEELSEAVWMERKDTEGMDDGFSLTREMMNEFAKNRVVFPS